MSTFFKVIRWLIAVFLIPVLFALVLSLTPATGVSKTFTDKNNIKGYIKDSGVYDRVVDIFLEFMTLSVEEKEEEGEEETNFFTDLSNKIKDKDSELGQLVDEILTPAFFENSVTTVIDATYDWLQGKTDKPTFEIKITKDKETFIRFLSVAFKEKMLALPECEAGSIVPPDFNPLESECRPTGFDLNEINNFISENSEREEFQTIFNQAKLSSENFNIDQDVTKKAQLVFSILKPAPQIALGVILLLSALLILIIPGFKKGFIITGVVLLLPSLIILLGKIYASQNFDIWLNQGLKNLDPQQAELIKNNFEGLAKAIYFDLLHQIQTYSLVIITLGIVMITAGILIKSKKTEKPNQEIKK